MKKRRIAIVAFMLATVLTLGVGYAAVSGVLNITGTGTFRGNNLAQNEILKAIKLTNPTPDDYATATITTDAVTGEQHTAVINVNFNDTTGEAKTYVSVTTITIDYSTATGAENYPDVVIEAPILTQPQDPNWTVETDWTEGKTLAFGTTTTITVTVKYKCDNPETVANATTTGNFAIKMNFATVDPSTAGA